MSDHGAPPVPSPLRARAPGVRLRSARPAERELEVRAATDLAVDGDRPAMRLDDALGDREAEARAPALLLAPLPVSVEHVRELLGRDARALIDDAEHDAAVALGEGQRDRRALRVLDRVADQVREHLQHAVAIRDDGDRVIW